MDYLKSLLGSQKSNQPQLVYNQESKSLEKDDCVKRTSPKSDAKIEKDKNNSSQVDTTSVIERLDVLGESIRDAAKKVIPLADDDCLSCKLIGTTVLWGCSAFIFRTGYKFRKNQIGYRKVTATLSYSSFAFCLFLLGTARLFDMSIFEKGTEKNLIQMSMDDINKLKEYLSKKSDKDK